MLRLLADRSGAAEGEASAAILCNKTRAKLAAPETLLALDHVEAVAGLVIAPISILLCLRGQGGLRRGGWGMGSLRGSQNARNIIS